MPTLKYPSTEGAPRPKNGTQEMALVQMPPTKGTVLLTPGYNRPS